MDLLEQKLNEVENFQEGADKIAEALDVSSRTFFLNKLFNHLYFNRLNCIHP